MTSPFGHAVLLQFKNPVRNIVEDVFYEVFDVLLQLYADIMGSGLTIDPSGLDSLNQIYTISMTAYFGLLGLVALSAFGLFQLFPGHEKMDPQRLFGRAVPATLSLFIVNPPGTGNAFSRGAFAWVIRLTNVLIELFLTQLGTDIAFSTGQLAGGLGGPFVMLGAAFTMGGAVILVELLLLFMLMVRQFAIYVTYAIYPLLIVFWVADMGPLKYAKELSMKFFRMATLLLAGGILIAGILAVGIGLISTTNPLFTTGGPAGGRFSPGAGVLGPMFKLFVLFATCTLPILLVYQMLGPVGDAVMSAASAGLDAGLLAVSGVAAVATGGASTAATTAAHAGLNAAKTAGAQVAKQGVKTAAKQAGKTAVKKGSKAASKKTLSKGASRAKSAGKRAVEKAPEAAKRVGKRTASEGRKAGQSMTQEALAGAPEPIEDEEQQQGPDQSPSRRTTEPSSPSTSSINNSSGSGPGGSGKSGSGTGGSGKSGLARLHDKATGSSGAPTNPKLSGDTDSRRS